MAGQLGDQRPPDRRRRSRLGDGLEQRQAVRAEPADRAGGQPDHPIDGALQHALGLGRKAVPGHRADRRGLHDRQSGTGGRRSTPPPPVAPAKCVLRLRDPGQDAPPKAAKAPQHPPPAFATVGLIAKCDQATHVILTGTVTEHMAKKGRRGKARTQAPPAERSRRHGPRRRDQDVPATAGSRPAPCARAPRPRNGLRSR